MLKTGLVSVTFRQLAPADIVRIAAEAGLDAIEWGGDIHVPHGNLRTARKVAALTRDSGLEVTSYGSYYVVGREDQLPFESVLETAIALGAPVIRVWAGDRSSADEGDDYFMYIADESRRTAEMAASEGIALAYEFHSGSLTDTTESAIRLLNLANHLNLKTHWQPPVGMQVGRCLDSLRSVLGWLANVHVFHWEGSPVRRCPLSEGTAAWVNYISAVESTGKDHCLCLEFVENDDPTALIRDAATLRDWLAGGINYPTDR